MTSLRSDDRDEYWADGFEVGTIATWAFAGAEGLRRLSGPAGYSASDPERFSARLSRVQLDHVALEAFASSPHDVARSEERIQEFPTPLMAAVLAVEGALEVEGCDGRFLLEAGEHMVVDSRAPLHYSARSDTRLLRAVVGLEHVPAHLQREGALLARALPRTRLSESYFMFVSGILRSTADGQHPHGAHLIAAVADLHSAVLAEARQIAGHPTGATGLRYRMEEYIETHLGDPGLDPTAVADSVGISVRHAHAVFSDGDRTIARFIVDRRISAVARELRTAGAPTRFDTLHRRWGFSSHDVLARSFRERFGMSPSDYRDGGHREFG